MSFLIPAAYADAAAPAAAAGPAGTGFEWVFLIGFLVIFYLMIWRPQAKRAKEHKNLLGSLQKGDEVVTSGGIAGKVTKVTDDFVVIEVSDSVELKFQKAAIAATLPKGTLKAI
ncbi:MULTISPECIES: preprotein translocase subunit YajC [Pseudomonas]|jgi:preprotein translocase subunit YajC|uniref:preprotein translocase subunit YajC n=1 Tax=Pseudomonadaceae TaxID=135621 RepID=UPI00041D646E|nr:MULTISPECIES: preprotein translocase subunit YajC [Pseudomonas]AYF88245.1 preprotein translocase subunit YajC [Pseudomonas sp. DY-1]MDE3736872.1 preprotein translocase subunit YajC [Pseudomonas resinovorans]MDH4584736.1 preprotein translocase subunit YajC [Pseudomonas sp. BN415]MDH4654525.1 preprotein translocase subunit YajC [Pseudomonas sp. BN606]MRK24179.1 preprotein translocase subunit YajC [Pseudomonas sp. JG-B]